MSSPCNLVFESAISVLALIAVPLATLATSGVSGDEQGSELRNNRGEVLFEQHCNLCHGNAGGANGPASDLLFPPARDFTRGKFKLASTTNGVPTNEDLVATLRRGMPGSAMPSWDWMAEEDLLALAVHVRGLAFDGIASDLRAEGDLSAEEIAAIAEERTTPGEAIVVGPAAPGTPEVLGMGMRVFLENCAACHGRDGKGHGKLPVRDEDDTLNWARDFTSGILKGGASHEDLTRRIAVGLHGTAMPGTKLDEQEHAALIAYVRSLIPAGAEDRLVQRRQSLRAVRVDASVFSNDSDKLWATAPEVDIVLAPLWWREGAVLHASVSAIHDGESLAVRIRWEDETPTAPVDLEWPLTAPPYADGVALQLSHAEHPTFFGMAPGPAASNIWHWRAIEVPDGADLQTLIGILPHRVGEWFTEEGLVKFAVYRFARGPIEIKGEAVSTVPAGVRQDGVRGIGAQERNRSDVFANAAWEAGRWTVTLTRDLTTYAPKEFPLEPGEEVSVGFAVWNGDIGDLRGQKSVTIWHALELEP